MHKSKSKALTNRNHQLKAFQQPKLRTKITACFTISGWYKKFSSLHHYYKIGILATQSILSESVN